MQTFFFSWYKQKSYDSLKITEEIILYCTFEQNIALDFQCKGRMGIYIYDKKRTIFLKIGYTGQRVVLVNLNFSGH
jgi:hypothetical protein